MNNRFKLRAWDLEQKKWVSFACFILLKSNDGSGVPKFSFPYQDDERFVYQCFTGLKDKNGRDIYEGDILKVFSFEDWGDTVGSYYNFEVKHETNHPSGESELSGFLYIPKNREVIGNIFENPDLPKV